MQSGSAIMENRSILYVILMEFVIISSIYLGMASSNSVSVVFNILQTCVKPLVSLIVPCLLNLNFSILGWAEILANKFLIVLGFIISFSTVIFLFQY